MQTKTKTNYQAGNLLLSGEEIKQAIEIGESVLLTFRKAYSIKQTSSGMFQIVEAYKERGKLPLLGKGRFSFVTPERANKLIGFELFLAEL
jgi:hypothetical protein